MVSFLGILFEFSLCFMALHLLSPLRTDSADQCLLVLNEQKPPDTKSERAQRAGTLCGWTLQAGRHQLQGNPNTIRRELPGSFLTDDFLKWRVFTESQRLHVTNTSKLEISGCSESFELETKS